MSKAYEQGTLAMRYHILRAAIIGAILALTAAVEARADAVTDWDMLANEIVVESKLGAPSAMRVMAIVQTAVSEAVRYVDHPVYRDAAVAAANRATLSKLLPAQQASIDKAYQAALDEIPPGRARIAGIESGERAAAAALAAAKFSSR